MLDKYELIRKYMKSRIGAPIVDLCDNELCATDEAVEAASTRYWTALPYQTTDEVYMSISCSQITKSVTTIIDEEFGTDPLKDDVYFIGVGRWDDSGLHNIHPLGTNYFDQKLLGKNFGYHPDNRPIEDPRYLGDRALLNSSNEDLLFGEPDIQFDYVRNELKFILPPVEGTLHLWYNWGFCPERTIEVLPMVHFDIFKKMVSYEFLEIIIAARSALSFSNSDYELDITDLTNKRDALKEELDKELSDTAIIVGSWG